MRVEDIPIDLAAVHSHRGDFSQHLMGVLASLKLIELNGAFFYATLIESEQDVELLGEGFALFIQVKKKEQLGQWVPSKIYEILKKMFVKWSNSLITFDEAICGDNFTLAIGGDISKDTFGEREDKTNVIINLDSLFSILKPGNYTLKTTSKIKAEIESLLKKEKCGYEPSRLNYFIHHLRLCPNLPSIEVLEPYVKKVLAEILSNLTSNTNEAFRDELFKKIRDIVQYGSQSLEPSTHQIDYIQLKQIISDHLENDLENYIKRLDRYRDHSATETVLKHKFKVIGVTDSQIIFTAAQLKTNVLRIICTSYIDCVALEKLYRNLILYCQDFQKKIINLANIASGFIKINESLFSTFKYLKDENSIKGIFFDLVSYCSISLEGVKVDG